MSNSLHFDGNSIAASRSPAGFYVRTPAGVRARPIGMIATWVDPCHELLLFRSYPEAFFGNPLNLAGVWSQYIGEATDGGLYGRMSWRYRVVVAIGKTGTAEVNMGGFGTAIPFSPDPVYENIGVPTWIRPLANIEQNYSVSGHRNFRRRYFRCYGQCNRSYARGFGLSSSDQGLIVGQNASISEPFYNFDSGTHFLEYSFIAPAGVTPNVWIDGGGEIIEATTTQRIFYSFPIHCLVSTGTGATYAETKYTTSAIVPENWGEGYVPGVAGQSPLLYSTPAGSPNVSTEVHAWKLFATVKESVPAGVYDLRFRTDTPGVATVGGYAAIETMTEVDRWRPQSWSIGV